MDHQISPTGTQSLGLAGSAHHQRGREREGEKEREGWEREREGERGWEREREREGRERKREGLWRKSKISEQTHACTSYAHLHARKHHARNTHIHVRTHAPSMHARTHAHTHTHTCVQYVTERCVLLSHSAFEEIFISHKPLDFIWLTGELGKLKGSLYSAQGKHMYSYRKQLTLSFSFRWPLHFKTSSA